MTSSTYLLGLQIGNVLSYLFMILFNTLSNVIGWNGGKTNSSVSNDHPTRFTPAGFAFSIWTLIFIGMGLFAIYQALPRFRKVHNTDGSTDRSLVERVGPFFIINGVLNGIWSIVFAYEIFWLSVLIMLTILGTLIAVYDRLPIGVRLVRNHNAYQEIDKKVLYTASSYSLTELWLVHLPFSIYLGWISVATIANLAIFFSAAPIHWPEWAEGWSIVMQFVATALAFGMLLLRLDPAYSYVISWGLFAIGVKQKDASNVETVAIVLASIIAVVSTLVALYRVRRYVALRYQ